MDNLLHPKHSANKAVEKENGITEYVMKTAIIRIILRVQKYE
jgi:hypothetical protein